MGKARRTTPVPEPQSPLFEPERTPPPPYQQPSVPIAKMVNPDAKSAAAAEKSKKNKDVGNLILRFRTLESKARQVIATRDANANPSASGSTVVPSKRKGMINHIRIATGSLTSYQLPTATQTAIAIATAKKMPTSSSHTTRRSRSGRNCRSTILLSHTPKS
jgi:hypothetical protein